MNEISIQTFADTVKQKLLQQLSASYPNLNIHLHQVPKPGGILLTGLSIQAPGSSVATILYLDDHYYHYREGTSMDDILCELAQAYEMCSHEVPNIDCKSLTDWNYSKSQIVGRFINISNQPGDRYLTTRPVTEIPGTSIGIVYDIDLSQTSENLLSAPVSFSMLESWNISIQELEKAAQNNLPVIRPVTICSINSLLEDSLPDLMSDQSAESTEMMQLPDTHDLPQIPLYLVTNTQNCYGAICITYPGVYEEICKKAHEDCYILPSSIHECICVPKSYEAPEELLSLVTEVNHSVVSKEDFLCNDVFEMQNGKLVSALTPPRQKQAVPTGIAWLPLS